jgi:acyl-CoA thioester hydrolase
MIMARIKLDLPKDYIFSTEIKIRITDLNYGGHVGNDKILSFLHDARVAFFQNLGYTNELNIEEKGIIMTDVAIVYKAEVFYGDSLEIKINLMDYSKYGFDMVYLLTSKDSGKEVARGKTGIVFFDYTQRKVSPIPENLLRKISINASLSND